ncbi:MAG: GspE/PulE family protein [Planctomycetota bacterium]|jgi:type II secretory ATPase GspE/PulE/Tfp pilus assembly ATPase PilB-like protein
MEHYMPDLLLTAVEYGGYISVVKFLVFLASFLPSLLLITWVYHDARTVETKEDLWTGVVFGTVAATTTIWLLVPVFVVGLVLYLIAVAAVSLIYVSHRNARVMDFDRVLTPDHIRSLLGGKEKKATASKSFLFVTANGNEVPVPQGKTPDFYGYKIALDLFNDAVWRRASDIVFVPTSDEYAVAYYVDGAILKQPGMPREQMEYFVRFVKHLADLDANERRKPQKGKFKIRQPDLKTDWEVITAGSTAGEQVKIKRIMQQEVTKLTEIGLMPNQLERLSIIRNVKQGLFIVGGPEKSGVTTTFYGLLRNHDAFTNSINTLERQIVAELPNITQNLFSISDTGTATYATELQTIVRMGPDIVGVAGCEDTDTAKIACEAAADGKIVYLTLKADSVLKTLAKWLELVGDKDLATGALLGIANQRLLRKLCEGCKQAYQPNKELLRKFSIPSDKARVFYRAGKVQYTKHGKPVTCEDCQGTGYAGRTGIFEMITIDNKLREAIRGAQSLSDIGAHLRGAKMLYLQEQALRKVIAGTTAINEMVRVLSKSKPKKAKSRQNNNSNKNMQ